MTLKPFLMKYNLRITTIAVLAILVIVACVKNKIDFVNGSQISGKLTYENLSLGKIAAPAGTKVNVYFNNNVDPTFTFLTTDSGKYVFSPQSKGKYTFKFSVIDTVMTYDSTLVQKADIDTTRKSSSAPVFYSTTVKPVTISVNSDQTVYTEDVDLTTSETGLHLQITDAQGRALPGARVCIYNNQSFASQNAPYCGGCLAYLSTDINGQIIFTGLSPGIYYINARADAGVVHINNQFSGAVNSASVTSSSATTLVTISLK
jgi:hypothetical protein